MMAEMCDSTLREMDRVYAAVSDMQQRKTKKGVAEGAQGAQGIRSSAVDVNVQQGVETSSGMPLYRPPYIYKIDRDAENAVQKGTQPVQMSNDFGHASLPLPPDFDLSMFDSVSDIDVFDYFDPDFDLEGIDACLQGNLDLSFPTTLQHPM